MNKLALTQQQAKTLFNLEVTVEIKLGEIILSAAEVLDLYPGQPLQFNFDPNTPVSLNIDGAEIARARFVQHDGLLSLEVVSDDSQEKLEGHGSSECTEKCR